MIYIIFSFGISYAYDDRWEKMSVGEFFKRRLVRLQPMVIMGMIIGAICFYFQDSILWPTIHEVPVWKMILVMAIGFTLIPVPQSLDIRGWVEMHPLDGPGWSLFYEYIGNILYALFVRKFSKTALSILVFLSGCALIHLAVTSATGDVIGGWSLDSTQIHIGLSRLMFPFFGGILLHRIVKITPINNAFFWSSLLIVIVLAMPRIGGSANLWANGLYDSLSIIFLFPLIVFLGASGKIKGKSATRICEFLGDISYPIYITHYAFIYIYTGWVADTKIKISEAYPYSILTLVTSIVVAYACLKLYDEPASLWLKNKILK